MIFNIYWWLFMGTITLSIPDKLLKKLKNHPDIKWSEVARIALKEKVNDLKRLEIYKDIDYSKKGEGIPLEKLEKELGIKDL